MSFYVIVYETVNDEKSVHSKPISPSKKTRGKSWTAGTVRVKRALEVTIPCILFIRTKS